MSVETATTAVAGPRLLGAPLELVEECMPLLEDANRWPHRAAELETRVRTICRDSFEGFDGDADVIAADLLIAFGWWTSGRTLGATS